MPEKWLPHQLPEMLLRPEQMALQSLLCPHHRCSNKVGRTMWTKAEQPIDTYPYPLIVVLGAVDSLSTTWAFFQ